MKKATSLIWICLIAVSAYAVLLSPVTQSSVDSSKDKQLTTDLNTEEAPVAIRDNTGKIWVFFVSYRSGGNPSAIWYETSDDNGKRWSIPYLLTTSIYPGGPISTCGISVMQDSTGKFWLVISMNKTPGGGDAEMWFMTSDDGGNTWSDPKKPYEGTAPWPGYGSPTIVEAFGKVWIFFTHYEPEGFKYVCSDDGGLTWSSPADLPAGGLVGSPHCMRDIGGNIWLFYIRQPGWYTEYARNISCMMSSDGVTWSSPINIEEMGPGQENYPWGIQDSSGRIVVFFDNFPSSTSDIFYVVSDNNGIVWSEPKRFTEDPSQDWDATAVTTDNGLLVLWVSNRSGNWDIWYRYFTIGANVDIDPDTLNLKSKGELISAYIELPEGYNVADINVSTVTLNDTVSAELKPTDIGDYDNDTVPDLMVKFDRAKVIRYILNSVDIEERFMKVTLTITGKLNDGTPFKGSDTIKIIMPAHKWA